MSCWFLPQNDVNQPLSIHIFPPFWASLPPIQVITEKRAEFPGLWQLCSCQSSYYATSVELIPLHCKPLISTIMTIDRFASILFFFFFPSSVFGTHSKSGFPMTYSHGPGLKHCLFKVVFIIYISGINYYSGLNYAFIFHLKMVNVHYQPLAIFKHF